MQLTSLADTRADIQNRFGSGAIRPANRLTPVTVISSGIFIIDLALLGGFAEVTGNMMCGWESSGKTSNLYRAVGQYQKKYPNKRVAWIDLDPMGFQAEWATALGCDVPKIELVQPPHGEAAVDCAEALAYTREIGLIVVDGISGFTSAKLIEEATEDVQIAPIAKNAGKFCTKMRVAMLERAKTGDRLTILSSNQWRFKITMMGDPRILPGGTHSNFFHQVKLELTAKQIDTANKKAGVKTDAYDGGFTAQKTKNPSGIRTGEFRIITDPQHPLGYGTVDEFDTILTYALMTGVIEGKAPKLNIPLFGAVFNSREEILARLRLDPAFNLFVRQATLSNWRRQKGHTPFPSDNWLCGSVSVLPGNVTQISVGGIATPRPPGGAIIAPPRPGGLIMPVPAAPVAAPVAAPAPAARPSGLILPMLRTA